MFLFILESIGTSELLLIGIIALIFLGPRKLPQIAKTIGKMMAEFRNTTNEFKETWQREVDFAEEAEALRTGDLNAPNPQPIARTTSITTEDANTIATPQIKAAQADLFDHLPQQQTEPAIETVSKPTTTERDTTTDELSDKKTWL